MNNNELPVIYSYIVGILAFTAPVAFAWTTSLWTPSTAIIALTMAITAAAGAALAFAETR